MSKITEIMIHNDILDQIQKPKPSQNFFHDIPINSSPIRCSFFKDNIEVGIVEDTTLKKTPMSFFQRRCQNDDKFNVAFIIPTGVGASTGGHAGDANVVLKLIASVSDTVFTHPNVVNASDLNEIPKNSYYIEGSILSRFLMGDIGLKHKRSNKILVILGKHKDDIYMNAAYNAVNAARATYGTEICDVREVEELKMSFAYTSSGRASGIITGIDNVKNIINQYNLNKDYDAIAIS